MLRIAVCDDNRIDRKQVLMVCKKAVCNSFFRAEYIEYESGEELINSDINFDILLLDYEMKQIDGLRVKKILEERNINTHIIFITGHSSIIEEAFGVYVYGFLTKPVNKMVLYTKITNLLKYIKHNSAISLETQNSINKVILSDIQYIETYKRKCRVVLKNHSILVKGSLRELDRLLEEYDFFRCEKSYIVNLQNISEINEDIVVLNGDRILVSRRNKELLRMQYEICKKNRLHEIEIQKW